MTLAAGTADVLLADGTSVLLRPIQPEDASAIVALHARFSERTRYLRYFSPYPRIPERDLHRFVNVDHRDREAFVVASGDNLVAVGRYERLGPGAEDAEVAFVVEDALQGKGIGSVLLEHLAAAARRVGITRFVAEVLPENSPMLRVFADAGYKVQRQYADGVVHLTFPIAPTERSQSVQWDREHRAEARSIARLLAPRAVAVYGASASGQGIGAAALGHLRDAGFTGGLHPIHPSARSVAGLPAHPSIVDVGEPVDLAVVAVPPDQVPDVVADAAAGRAHGLVVVSAGFAETGPAGAAAQSDLLRAARAAGMRLVGPNCLGIANTDQGVRLNATLAPVLPPRGRAGFFCQSGALGVALLAEAERRGLGLSSFVSAGNRADVSGNDLLQYWQDDPATDVVLLYLETFGNPRKFARLARRIGRNKPVVAVASPVRGPVAGGEAASALFAHSGVIRVDTVAELFDVGALLAHQPLPTGRRVGIVTNSAALGWLAAGACRGTGLSIVDGYPRGGEMAATPFAEELASAMSDERVDALVVTLAPPLPGAPVDSATVLVDALTSVAGSGDKPVVATFLAGQLPAHVPSYPSVEEAVRALARVVRYADWRRTPTGTIPELSDVDVDAGRAAVRQAVETATAAPGPVPGLADSAGRATGLASSARVAGGSIGSVGPAAGLEPASGVAGSAALADAGPLLSAYGIQLLPSTVADSEAAVEAAAKGFGYPVALKAARRGLRHRLDLGAVRLDLADPTAVRRAYREIAEAFGAEVLVQPMVPPGVACVVEVVEDPAFGPVVGFGLGGVASELLRDRAWRPAPLTDLDAAALVNEPRAAPLLHGYRGAEPVDEVALVDLLLRVGRLVDDRPEIRGLELNPVLARASGLSVLHATIQIGHPVDRLDSGPRHL